MRDCFQERAEVIEIQIVSRIDAKSSLLSGSRSGGVLRERSVSAGGWEIASVRFGVKLDAMCSGCGDERHDFRRWVHEDRDSDAGGSEWRDDSFQQIGLRDDIPAVIGGPLIGSVGDQRALFWPDCVDEAQKIVGRVAFDVELDAKFASQLPQFVDVAGASMSFIRPRMNGDPSGSGGDAQASESRDIGQAVVSRVSEQGDLVEVRTEGGHGWLSSGGWALLPVRGRARVPNLRVFQDDITGGIGSR